MKSKFHILPAIFLFIFGSFVAIWASLFILFIPFSKGIPDLIIAIPIFIFLAAIITLLLYVSWGKIKRIEISSDGIYYKSLFSLYTKFYSWKDFDYTIYKIEHGKNNSWENLIFIKDKKKVCVISSVLYKNYDELKTEANYYLPNNDFVKIGLIDGIKLSLRRRVENLP